MNPLFIAAIRAIQHVLEQHLPPPVDNTPPTSGDRKREDFGLKSTPRPPAPRHDADNHR